MSCTGFYEGDTIIHRLDPRPRILATLAFSFIVALSSRWGLLASGLVTGAALALTARIPAAAAARRLLRLNLFMALLFVLVPLTYPGRTLFEVWGVPYSAEGIYWSLGITLKANAIVLVFTALMGTIDPLELGHAFHHLRVPTRLAHLFMFTMRYSDTLHLEYMKLIRAMKARGFRPSMRLHTYRTYAYMTGMLLVRSLERSERIMAAMRCRGFRGDFHVVSHFHLHRRDLVFTVSAVLVLTLMALVAMAGPGGP